MNTPLISIITCTKNSEKFLPECLNSILGQLNNDIEHIFVDGNSTDSTILIIEEYKKEKNNVYLYLQEPKGVYNAMNFGISKASGKYIWFINSDDYLLPGSIKKVIDIINNTKEKDYYYGRIKKKVNGEIKNPLFNFFMSIGYNKILLGFISYMPHSASIIKKSLYERFNLFDTQYKVAGDVDFFMKAGDVSNPYFIDDYLTVFRVWNGSLSTGKLGYNRELQELITIKKNNNVGFSFFSNIFNKVYCFLFR